MNRRNTNTAPPVEKEGRELPHLVEVEQAVIGCLLVDNSHFDKLADLIDAETFYDPLHQRIIAKALALWAAGNRASPLSVGAALQSDEGLKQVGGHTYLANLARSAPVVLDLRGLCRLLLDRAQRRAIISVGENLIERAHDTASEEAADVARSGAEVLCDVGTGRDETAVRKVGDVARESLRQVERALKGEKLPAITTGLAKLDEKIGGWAPGDLIVVPARPGMGKSAFAASIALRAALAGYPVIVFSLEMTADQWTTRNVCDLDFDVADPAKPLWYESFRRGTVKAEQFDRAALAQQRLAQLENYLICDDDRMTAEDVSARARAFRSRFARSQLGLIAVDYLQKVPVVFRKDRTREAEVAHIAHTLKSLAKQSGWPVVALAQLSRAADKRGEDDRRPTLADLRESGQIEAEADLVIAPFRPGYYVEQKRPGSELGREAWAVWNSEYGPIKHNFEAICRKNRHGRTFEAHLWCEIGANAIRDQAPAQAVNDPGAELAQEAMF